MTIVIVSYTLNLRADGIKVNPRLYRYYFCVADLLLVTVRDNGNFTRVKNNPRRPP
jgi:hypothetical protein